MTITGNTSQLTIIGCGTLGAAVVDGLLAQSQSNYLSRLCLTARRPEHITSLQQRYPEALVTANNRDRRIWAARSTPGIHLVMIATQPQFTKAACRDIDLAIEQHSPSDLPVVLTVCPGITTTQLEAWLPRGTPVVRSMPNIPLAAQQGATALFANQAIGKAQLSEVRQVFAVVSPSVEVMPREELMDVAASVSGSAPAYIFYLLRCLIDAAVAKGLPAELARPLVIQSCIGSGILAQASESSMPELLADVCVPGGSTEQAMHVLDTYRTADAVQQAVYKSWIVNRKMGATSPPVALTDSGHPESLEL
ncbi:hypothetical protein BBP40_001328 [Aspergillus hancockii]|nr:hypothetical protein BBP40_001328 [Aspergillus hancockii]